MPSMKIRSHLLLRSRSGFSDPGRGLLAQPNRLRWGVAACVLALAGCGGSGHPAATTTSQPGGAGATTTSAQTAPAQLHRVVLGKAAYEKAMQRLGRSLSVSLENMFPLADDGPGSAETTAALVKVRATRATIAHIGVTLQAIVPPKPVRADHARLISAVGDLRGELDTLISVLQTGGSKRLGAYTEFKALSEIALASTAIEKKGYAIG
jgi:hypothetical protein